MASFTHDLGMVVFYENVENRWKDKAFGNYLKVIKENSVDASLKEAAINILKLKIKYQTILRTYQRRSRGL